MFHFSLHQQSCGTEEKRTTQPTTGTSLLFDGSCPFATAVLLLMNARGWGNPVSCLFKAEMLFGKHLGTQEEQEKRSWFSSSVSWGLREEPPCGTMANLAHGMDWFSEQGGQGSAQ